MEIYRVLRHQLDADCRAVHQRRHRKRRCRDSICNMGPTANVDEEISFPGRSPRFTRMLILLVLLLLLIAALYAVVPVPLPAGSRENQLTVSVIIRDCKHGWWGGCN